MYKVIAFVMVFYLGGCTNNQLPIIVRQSPNTELIPEYQNIEIWRKGDKKKCTGDYSINVDSLNSRDDFQQIIELMEVENGWARLYYHPDSRDYFVEVFKCPNSESLVEGYLKKVQVKYPEAIINND
jgi:hypothetical protein